MTRNLLAAALLAAPLLASAQQDTPDLTLFSQAARGAVPDAVAPSAVPGLYELVLGSQVFYISADGRYVVEGDLIDLQSGDSVTEISRGRLRAAAIDAVAEKEMVVFAPDGEVRHTVTVFTDIDCGYCRKLHSEMADYNAAGIKIRYLAFPRSGVPSGSADKAVSVWCAEDRQAAMTAAKAGESLPPAECDNPVQAQYQLGMQLGIRGTPAMILPSGEMVPGYVPADRLAASLEGKPAE